MIRNRKLRFIAQLREPLGVRDKHASGWSKRYVLTGTIEQPVSVLLLQLANLRANRRLRAKYLLPGTRKTTELRDLQECHELIEVHSLSVIIDDRARKIGVIGNSDRSHLKFAALEFCSTVDHGRRKE